MSEPEADFVSRVVREQTLAERGGDRPREAIRFWPSELPDLLEVRDNKKKRGGGSYSSPSGCKRKVYLKFFKDDPRFTVPTVPMSAEALLNMDVGNAYHGILEERLKRAGILIAAEFPLRDHPLFSGRIDGIVYDPAYGLIPAEFKSMSPWKFDNADEVDPGHAAQVLFYAWRIKARAGRVVGMNKANGRLKEWTVTGADEIGPAIEAEAARLAVDIAADREAGQMAHLPPIPEGAKPGGWPCSWGKEGAMCAFFKFCHPDAAVEAEAPGEIGLTLGTKKAVLAGGD